LKEVKKNLTVCGGGRRSVTSRLTGYIMVKRKRRIANLIEKERGKQIVDKLGYLTDIPTGSDLIGRAVVGERLTAFRAPYGGLLK
jgi:hypothetical protein